MHNGHCCCCFRVEGYSGEMIEVLLLYCWTLIFFSPFFLELFCFHFVVMPFFSVHQLSFARYDGEKRFFPFNIKAGVFQCFACACCSPTSSYSHSLLLSIALCALVKHLHTNSFSSINFMNIYTTPSTGGFCCAVCMAQARHQMSFLCCTLACIVRMLGMLPPPFWLLFFLYTHSIHGVVGLNVFIRLPNVYTCVFHKLALCSLAIYVYILVFMLSRQHTNAVCVYFFFALFVLSLPEMDTFLLGRYSFCYYTVNYVVHRKSVGS